MKVGAGTTTAIFFLLDIVYSSFFFLVGSTVNTVNTLSFCFVLFFCLLSAVENLQNLLFTRIRDRKLKDEMEIHGGQLRTADTVGVADDNPAANAKKCEIHMLGPAFL